MNYDGPSFYKKRESNHLNEKSQEQETPLDRLKKERKRKKRLNEELLSQQVKKEARPENYYFRKTQIPKSLQNREGWKKETWTEDLVGELQERLKKEPGDYLLFADHLVEEVLQEEQVENSKDKSAKTTAEAMRIQKKVAEIESTLDTAALIQKEMKPELKKPNTGLHRTLSNIIAADKNGKNNLNSLFSD